MRIFRTIILAAFVAASFGTVAPAQVTQFDGFKLKVMCGQGRCANAIRAAVNQVKKQRLTEAEFNTQLGIIAAALFDEVEGADQNIAFQIADALRILAGFSGDEDQRDSLIWVSQEIFNGNDDLFDLEDPFAVSPS